MSRKIEDKKEKESMIKMLFSIMVGVIIVTTVVVLIGIVSDNLDKITNNMGLDNPDYFDIIVDGYDEVEGDGAYVFNILKPSSSENTKNFIFIGSNSDKVLEIKELLDNNYTVRIKGSGSNVEKIGNERVINLDNVDKLEYEINDISG